MQPDWAWEGQSRVDVTTHLLKLIHGRTSSITHLSLCLYFSTCMVHGLERTSAAQAVGPLGVGPLRNTP